MAEIGQWNGHVFEVSPELIRSWTGLTIKASCETKEKEYSKKKYAAFKNGKPTTVSLTVGLSAFTGCDVRKEVTEFLDDAQQGKQGYFYIGEEKLVPYELLLADASVNQIEISPSGIWIRAEVALNMKQASRDDRDPPPTPNAVIWAAQDEKDQGPRLGGGGGVWVNETK